MDMVVVILAKDQLMLSQSLRLVTFMEDMVMAVVSMVVATMEREMLMLNPRLMQDIMVDMATVDMVVMEDMVMAVVSMVVATMEREMLMLNPWFLWSWLLWKE